MVASSSLGLSHCHQDCLLTIGTLFLSFGSPYQGLYNRQSTRQVAAARLKSFSAPTTANHQTMQDQQATNDFFTLTHARGNGRDNTRSDDSSPSESTSKPAIQVTPPTTQTPAITPSPQPPIPTTVDNTTPSSSKATGPSNALSPLPPPASSSLKSTHSRSSSKHSHRSGTDDAMAQQTQVQGDQQKTLNYLKMLVDAHLALVKQAKINREAARQERETTAAQFARNEQEATA
ncbi:hypothetical protein PtA15_10A194 [Puccinia triticina]|uniref:Uncharacterized protein n=1 Tax=Puccinia triticina TaxID=208348 RepID=A0ABY7CYA4_9BASI|nr:uncharacterized protein PtA15_10A194 [Puccinia triticina]WAQ88775.1 hypothetical protein PtA15_10A194 [Puccinia triticina]